MSEADVSSSSSAAPPTQRATAPEQSATSPTQSATVYAQHFQSPAMRQYATFKAAHPECVLFFRMGDFYEMFAEDAIVAHKALGITLTERTKGLPMAGVPYHSVEPYLRKMVALGHRVAVCEQMQDPKDAKGVLDRAVTRVLTPGTLIDDALLDASRACKTVALSFTAASAQLASIELSTGAFEIAEVPLHALGDELARLAPAEIIHAEDRDGTVSPHIAALRTGDIPLTARASWYFRLSDATEALKSQFRVGSLEGFGFAAEDPSLCAAGALLRYILETQPTPAHQARPLAHLSPPKRRVLGSALAIDATSLRSLEIERTMRSGDSALGLLSVFDDLRTPMGKRLLRDWLCFPLAQSEKILTRQRAVAAFVEVEQLRDSTTILLDQISDVLRISGRLALGRVTPRDLGSLARSLVQADALRDVATSHDALLSYASASTALAVILVPYGNKLRTMLVDAPPLTTREGGIIRDGADAALDEQRSLQRDANVWLAQYQARLCEETGIANLKVGFNSVFGYYIELTAVQSAKAPATFTRRQTLRNAERYITPELKEFEDNVLRAESRALEREKELFAQLVSEGLDVVRSMLHFGEIAAEIDALYGLASTARRSRWARPEIVTAPMVHYTGGRHPVLERMLGTRFVPNDLAIGAAHASAENGTLALITGPNMAGKSTFIRQTALIALLAHVGSFVPAEAATIGLLDRIFTRIGSADELHSGQSTFMVEMTETANILHHATARSLVILDEIGRGTSTLDGLSLAWATAETLAERAALTLFATHYHELTQLADELPRVINLHVSVREWNDEVVFLHRILPGRTDRSYGIHVARLAGLPDATVQRAKEILEALAVLPSPDVAAQRSTARTAVRATSNTQMPLFTEFLDHPALAQLRALQLESMTPMDAFDALRKLKSSL
ncbi:MAG: DNA mismatch repair protein MutS [Phycisphaerales bacterium]|nr:DNA mismatch repair protein MutS [Phycisphaerales bacterium]